MTIFVSRPTGYGRRTAALAKYLQCFGNPKVLSAQNFAMCSPAIFVTELLAATRRRVLFGSFGGKTDGMHLMVMRQTHLIRCCQNVFRLLKFGGFAVVPSCVLMMFGRTLMKVAQC
jgi:hypothetical protein